jgi:hypothetical protein
LVLGAWCLVLGSWCLVLGAWFAVLGSPCDGASLFSCEVFDEAADFGAGVARLLV